MVKITSNKVVAFNVPQTEHEVVRIQIDALPYFYDQLHQHPEIQVMLIGAGEGTLIAGDYVGRFQPDEVYVIGSGQPHVFRCDQSFYKKNSISRARSISLYFSEKYFGKELWDSNELVAFREFAAASKQGFQVYGQAGKEAIDRIMQLSRSEGLTKMVQFFSLIELLIKTGEKKTLAIQFSRLLSGVGVMALAGIVVRNGILLVEFTDLLRSQGMELREAIAEATKTRMTPVLLTAMAATLGLIPLAVGLNIDFVTLFTEFNPHIYFGGDNVAFWGPLSWTMIFGLIFGTFLTLFLVPVMYLLVAKLKERVYKVKVPSVPVSQGLVALN